MRRSLALATALALLAAASLSASGLAGTERPISGQFTVGVVPVEQRCGPNALTIGFEGAGIATHLGRMTGTGSNCTEFSLATESVGIWDGVATFIAADGSSFTVHYEGVQAAPVAGVAWTETINTVESGTGRFEGAEGSWTQSGQIDFTTGLFSGSFSGSISY
jgi:hypothetical protein